NTVLSRPGNEETFFSVYDCFTIKGHSILTEHNDIGRILYLIPNNPEPVLAQVISKALKYNTFWESGDQKIVVNALEAIVPLEVKYKETGHLFIATCMLSSDKTIQSFAAELWIRNVVSKNVDSRQLGEIIGTQESIEFAPLKRFTDLLSGNLL